MRSEKTAIMNVLIAGGAGSIGSHLCDALVDRGDSVVVVDNLITGRIENIAHHLDNPNLEFKELDLTQPLRVGNKHKFAPLDVVVDLASPASPADFLRLPLEILEVGSTGTRTLLDLALINDARFVLGSTSEIYGDPLQHPQKESYLGNVDCIGPRSCYDEAKRFSEALTAAYQRKENLSAGIVRIFNTYGPRMRHDDGRVLTNFVVQALTGKPITVYGDGSQTRSFCHVSDQVTGLLHVIENEVTEPINIGNPDERSILDIANLVKIICNSDSEIITVPLPPERRGDPKQRCPDISKIKNLYGWEPKVTLEYGLNALIARFAKDLNIHLQ
tara:strand:+ start:610 stop:1602 length:993 start_codon:yes stop_codon:yes gene_type:complete